MEASRKAIEPDGRTQVGVAESGWKQPGKQSGPTEEKLAGRGIGVGGVQEVNRPDGRKQVGCWSRGGSVPESNRARQRRSLLVEGSGWEASRKLTGPTEGSKLGAGIGVDGAKERERWLLFRKNL